MAWTEQCKIVFKQHADHFYFSQTGRKSLTKVFKRLSQESGVPFKTLKRWYYDKEKEGDEKLNSLKNEPTPELTENKDNTSCTSCIPLPICIKCKKNPVELDSTSRKPKTKQSKYYGLCGYCRQKAKVIDDAIALANEDGVGEWTSCPKCHHQYLIPNKEEIL